MRPIPQNRHLAAVIILASASALAGYLAVYDNDLSNPQINIAAAALKRHDPSLFPHDPIFGQGPRQTTGPAAGQRPQGLWLFHTPAYQSILELALVPTGYRDLLIGFRIGAAVQTMLFLCGMYALLFWQTRSWSVSVFTAVLAARLIETPGGGVWGSGALSSVTPAGLCIATWPLIVLAFARHSGAKPGGGPTAPWRLVLVFVVVGLLGNFHLVTAMNMTLVLLITYVIRQRFSPRCLPTAAAAGAAALLGALPYVWYYFSLRTQMSAGHEPPPTSTVIQAVRIGGLSVFYPELLKSLLDWRVLAGVIVLGIPAAAVLVKVERYITQNVRLWIGLIVGSVLVAMALHGASQLYGKLTDQAPPVIDFVEAAALLMLPLYVLLGQAITNLFRLVRTHRSLMRWALAGLLGLWMVPSDNLRVARWKLEELGTSFLSDDYKPDSVFRHRELRAERLELEAIAQYAGRQSDAIFITDHAEFRILARKPILAGPDDVRYLYYLAPWRLGQWLKDYDKDYKTGDENRTRRPAATTEHAGSLGQEEILAGTPDGRTVLKFVHETIRNRPDLANVEKWYIIFRPSAAPTDPGPLKLVEPQGPDSAEAAASTQPAQPPQWGKYYRLYQIDPERMSNEPS